MNSPLLALEHAPSPPRPSSPFPGPCCQYGTATGTRGTTELEKSPPPSRWEQRNPGDGAGSELPHPRHGSGGRGRLFAAGCEMLGVGRRMRQHRPFVPPELHPR